MQRVFKGGAKIVIYPTRIIEEPKKYDLKKGHQVVFLKCDDGKTYTYATLGKLFGMCPDGMRKKIIRNGWQNIVFKKDDIKEDVEVDTITPPPTRIIKEPWYDTVRHGSHCSKTLMFLCDNGVTYTSGELLEVTNMTSNMLHARLNSIGWDSPDMLKEKQRATGGSRNKPQAVFEQNATWEGLSPKDRSANLSKMTSGSWEREQV